MQWIMATLSEGPLSSFVYCIFQAFLKSCNKLLLSNMSFFLLFIFFHLYFSVLFFRSYGKENNNNENEWILLCLENHRRQQGKEVGRAGATHTHTLPCTAHDNHFFSYYYYFLLLCKLVSIMHDIQFPFSYNLVKYFTLMTLITYW